MNDAIQQLIEEYEKRIFEILSDLIELRKQRTLNQAEKDLIKASLTDLETVIRILKKGR